MGIVFISTFEIILYFIATIFITYHSVNVQHYQSRTLSVSVYELGK